MNTLSPLHGNRTALAEAALRKNKEAFTALVRLGTDPTFVDLSGMVAGQYLAAAGWADPKCVEGAGVFRGGGGGCGGGGTPVVVIAAIFGHSELVSVLCDGGVDLDASDADGNTALHYAATLRHSGVVDLLLGGSAKCALRNADGETPLHSALKLIDDRLSNYLKWVSGFAKEAGMARTLEELERRVWPPKSRRLARRKAKDPRRMEVVSSLLLRGGADIEARTDVGKTVLHYVVMYEDVMAKEAEFLLEHGAGK